MKASEEGLEKIRQARDRLTQENGWAVDNEHWLEEAAKFLPLDKLGNRAVTGTVSIGTWKRFLSGKGVKATSFRAFCSVLGLDWQQVSEPNKIPLSELSTSPTSNTEAEQRQISSIQDWEKAPEVSAFVGRTTELIMLEQWIVEEQAQLVAIVGMGGIGKTNLSVRLGKGGIGKSELSLRFARSVHDEFEYVIWRSLLNTLPFTDLLSDLIRFLSNQQETDLPETTEAQLARLLFYLKEHRCLLILDNVESVLSGDTSTGQYQKGYEAYGQLFNQIGELSHQSCVLLTSREIPKEVALSEIRSENNQVRLLRLTGLGTSDGRQMLEQSGSYIGSEAEWEALIKLYDGNPLALKLVAKYIQVVFFSNIADFLEAGQPMFSNIENLLDWHFNRLLKEEKEVMHWLAINREPVSRLALIEDVFSSESKKQVASVLFSLSERSLLDQAARSFTLQPVLMEYMTECFVKEITEEIKTQNIYCLHHYALSKAQAKDYIREMQNRQILQPVVSQLIDEFGDQSGLLTQLKNLLDLSRDQAWRQGYIGGNILNLLCQLQSNVTGYDFSHLTIRQAYLQNITLNNVSFAHSEFVQAVFTQTFGSIQTVTFSPDGKLLAASSGSDAEIRIWRVADGQELATFRGHTNWVCSLKFSPDGKILASGSDDSTIRLWDIHQGQCLKVLTTETGGLRSIAFRTDNQTLISGNVDCTVRLWDFQTGECLKTFAGHTQWVVTVDCNFNGQFVASGSSDRTIRLWDTSSGECLRVLVGHTSSVLAVAFSPDNRILASSSHDGTIRFWDFQTGQCLKLLGGQNKTVWAIAFSPDGQALASCHDDGSLRLWNIQTGECLRAFKGHTSFPSSIAFNPDGQTLASGSDDLSVRLWEIETGRCLRTFRGYTNSLSSIALSPANNHSSEVFNQILAIGGSTPNIQLWNLQTETYKILSGHTRGIWAVAYSLNGQMLASASDDKTVRLWDVRTGQCLNVLKGHSQWVLSVAFSPDGQILASGSDDRTVRLWDVQTGRCIHIMRGHTGLVWSVAFSPDGKTLVSCSQSPTVSKEGIRLWDVQTGQCIKVFHEETGTVLSVIFSPDGQILASCNMDSTVKLWDTQTGECIKTLLGHTDKVWSVAFSQTEKIIISSGDDKTIKVWDMDTGQSLNVLYGHTDSVRSAIFSRNGDAIISCSHDGTIKFWDTKTSNCTKTLSASTPYKGMNILGTTGLTPAQRESLKALGAIEKI
ncbi:MAG: hypothetical protein KME07_21355 [Pegethrix bostrychoides GSE-TBD4-15B]|uniref:NB-ARC domain-containing protein n=1 Tax=Pegethrix bostrychoides GSE-TBD4-15B TaxID=2839662 RepID=A0A951PE27_9CYAN|nr:hypothetical protein [Pegethrix bostrychoides GSE-TBD4-15B]